MAKQSNNLNRKLLNFPGKSIEWTWKVKAIDWHKTLLHQQIDINDRHQSMIPLIPSNSKLILIKTPLPPTQVSSLRNCYSNQNQCRRLGSIFIPLQFAINMQITYLTNSKWHHRSYYSDLNVMLRVRGTQFESKSDSVWHKNQHQLLNLKEIASCE